MTQKLIKILCGNLFIINLGFVYFITINSDVPLTCTAKRLAQLYALQYGKSSQMVPLCMLSVHAGQHHMAELLVIVIVWQLEIILLALTVFSNLDSVFTSFISHCIEQQWPDVLGDDMDKYSINSMIKARLIWAQN